MACVLGSGRFGGCYSNLMCASICGMKVKAVAVRGVYEHPAGSGVLVD